MLSRAAERLYWMARYVERAENTARMIMAPHALALDLPRTTDLSWRVLVDAQDPSSIFSLLRATREDMRTTRELVPTAAWEVVNELYRFAREILRSLFQARVSGHWRLLRSRPPPAVHGHAAGPDRWVGRDRGTMHGRCPQVR